MLRTRSHTKSVIPSKARSITTDGLYIQISHYARSTETEGLQHVNALSFAPAPLPPFLARLVELERYGIQTIRNEHKEVVKRGLTGDVLYGWIAKRLRDEGYKHIHAMDVRETLEYCERIMRARVLAGKE